ADTITRDVVFTSTRDGSLTALGPGSSALTGWTGDAWLGRPLACLVHGDDLPALLEALRHVQCGETPSRSRCACCAGRGITPWWNAGSCRWRRASWESPVTSPRAAGANGRPPAPAGWKQSAGSWAVWPITSTTC